MKLAEIAARIEVHLKGFESYSGARAWAGGRWVYVAYSSYLFDSHLSKADAERYLDWLNAGNIGRHWQALR